MKTIGKFYRFLGKLFSSKVNLIENILQRKKKKKAKKKMKRKFGKLDFRETKDLFLT